MDIYEYLKKDHQKVAKLFDLFESAPSERNQLEIIDMIRKELLVHAESENKTFYKKLESYHENKKDVHHSKHEHEEIKDLLEVLSDASSINKAVKDKVKKLKELVEHHVSEEESTLFHDAKKVLSEEEAIIIKEKMHAYKEKILNNMEVEEASI